ncbi:hypothetical protein PSCICL_46480 [Pseudomonas cichorii]|nr:hypothetical protein PSCICE_27430 [Pseudomonas cichorii]GFM62199.1 hypothetical protein PSCICG_33590 [Pseudomonas cichorii]GFM73656.1 hypothetical protein PSCICL_46480 [Pseudomonas cichorii]GFM78746.1 hypothetical protein PSCICM_45650 [Pseudomonas cichorii]
MGAANVEVQARVNKHAARGMRSDIPVMEKPFLLFCHCRDPSKHPRHFQN